MSDRLPTSRLRGRRSECEALDRLITDVGARESRVLVLCGEAGVGKTALLEYVSTRASRWRVARAAGVESEVELAFAGVQQLCAPMLGRLDRLPGPQRDALATAFGLRAGDTPDRFLVGLAVLMLLSDAAEEQPLVCLVDDAQWLDQASRQTLAFVARRLLAESVALVFATRSPVEELRGLPELPIDGLRDADAHALLQAALSAPLDPAVRDAIIAETRGNPLALLELPHGLAPDELAGGFRLLDALPFGTRPEEMFRHRLEALPDETQRLLLIAAAEPSGDPTLLWRAAQELDIGFEAAGPATAAGLFEIGTRATFRHPLVRSAVYRAASPENRASAHLALAEATDPQIDPDRRAWHHAQAATGPDAQVAAELERSADRAQARGGLAAASAFLERAAALTLDSGLRTARLLTAAEAKHQAGAPNAALALVNTVEAGPLDDLQRARVDLLRAQIAFVSSNGREAPPLLLAAARQLEPLAPEVARDTYLDALSAAIFVGRMAGNVGLTEVAEAARAAPSSCARRRAPDLLLDGLALLVTDGYAAGTPLVKGAVSAFRAEGIPAAEALRWLWLATHASHDVWDDESWEWLCTRHVRLARQAGALTVLPIALSARVGMHLYAGELAEAASLVEEAEAVTEATGTRLPRYGALALAAWRGREAEVAALFDASLEEATARGEGMGWTLVHNAAAVLYNGLGRYEDALDAAARAAEHPEELGFATLVMPELVEAAVRCGERERAAAALQRLTNGAQAAGTDWGLGLEARCRALLSEDDGAEALHRHAVDRLRRTRMRMELARAQLLYGEWLRRTGRRADARQELRTAYETLSAMGADAFAGRARRELLATGETVRKRTVETLDELTPQEAQIARLARDGHSNPEIGTELFISPRTVEYHLHKVFAKLGISSRRQLRAATRDPGLVVSSA
jgi:DNA-binding CsgD family transcriptional regulator